MPCNLYGNNDNFDINSCIRDANINSLLSKDINKILGFKNKIFDSLRTKITFLLYAFYDSVI